MRVETSLLCVNSGIITLHLHHCLQALKDHSNRLGTSRSGVLLLLQDVSSTTGLLPHRLRLASVPNLKYRRHGGEASIWIGTMGDQEVVSRQTKPPSDGDWESEEGQAILKVRVPPRSFDQRHMLTSLATAAIY